MLSDPVDFDRRSREGRTAALVEMREAAAGEGSLVAVKRRPPRTMEEEIEGPRAYMLGRFAEFIEQTLGLG